MDYTKPEYYAVGTQKWREYLDLRIDTDSEMRREACQKIEDMKKYNSSKYDEFMSDARAWAVRENQLIAEQNEKGPVIPKNSGRNYDDGEFIALNMSTANGVLEIAMEKAYKSGDMFFGYIISAYSNTKWRYDITCINYNENGITPNTFLEGASRDKVIESNVNSEFTATSSFTQLPYRKKGTCNIRLEYVGNTNVSKSDSPQYNDGKERVPVHYTV